MPMNNTIFKNADMLSWLGYFADKMNVSPEKFKMLNICGREKNVIPAIDTHKRVIIFADEMHEDIFYKLWEAGYGEYDLWIGTGTTPADNIMETKLSAVINMKITGPTVIFVKNEKTREAVKIGMKNELFTSGSVQYVGNEIRAVIMSILAPDAYDTILAVNAESIVIEAAITAGEGTIIAVEPDEGSRRSMEGNVEKFGVHNVQIIPDMQAETLAKIPVPRLAFIVANHYLESDMTRLLQINPNMQFVIYTLDLGILADAKNIFDKLGIANMEAIQISVSKTNKNNMFVPQPAPWIITGGME